MRILTFLGMLISLGCCQFSFAAHALKHPAHHKHQVHQKAVSSVPVVLVDSDEKININTADIHQLTQLAGIGSAKAKALLDYRNTHGAFKQLKDVTAVPGFSTKLLTKLQDHLIIG
ncbi:MAG: hypothetical protein DHS20C10_10590 [marine bacterium B5-7]|nr:MAG: hypothetical protein DHS20C10_10590 [marine bacterium B5-7]